MKNVVRGRKRKLIKRAIAAVVLGYQFKYGRVRINQTSDLLLNPTNHLVTISEASKNALRIRGGDQLSTDEQDELVRSVLAKTSESDYSQISINKVVKKIINLIDPVISDQRFWRILTELEKPSSFTKIELTHPTTIETKNFSRPKGFENVKDDFENRLTEQKSLNNQESKLSQLHSDHLRRVRRFNRIMGFLKPRWRQDPTINFFKSGLPHKKMVSVIKQEKLGSSVNSLGRSQWRSRIFSMGKSDITPTPNPTPSLFTAHSKTGEIHDFTIAFNQFKNRMTQIGGNYTGEKKEYFFEQLNECKIERFIALSTELGHY